MTTKEIESFIWGVADLIRDSFKRGKYQDVILPLTVLRRIECVLAPTREKVLQANARFKKELRNLDNPLRKASGYAFYNTSKSAYPVACQTALQFSAWLGRACRATELRGVVFREVCSPGFVRAWQGTG